MSAPMQLTDWLDATASNYLEDFVPAGGSAVKFAIAMGDVSTSEITAGVSDRAQDLGFLTAKIDASRVKIGSIEKVLGTISAQIDLYDLIDKLIVNLMADQHWVAPAPGPEPLAERLAASNGIDAESLALMARPALVQKIFRSDQIAQDMRSAILGLANERLIGGESMVTAFSTIGEWLTGNLTKISSVRRYQIHSKVNRGNARFLFESLLQVIKLAGIPGMVVTVDISRFLNSEKQPDQISYAKASLLDAYEVLREFVDATDDLENFLMVVAAPMSFLDIYPVVL